MLPLALLPLELLLVGLVVAESSVRFSPIPRFFSVRSRKLTRVLLACLPRGSWMQQGECVRDGLGDKLNNQLGQTPCAVKTQIQRACTGKNDAVTRNCTCNTMFYNVCAACAACDGQEQQTWADWADENDCKPNPAPFPPQVNLDKNTVPDWAYQNLTSNNDFNLTAALQTSPQSGPSKAAQIAVPIAAAAGMAVLAGLLFWWYRRRKWQRQRNARMQPLAETLLAYPRRWADELWLKTHSTRLKPSPKDASWEIDDDAHWLHRGSFYDPYSPPADRQAMHELGVRPSHTREASSSTLLPHIEFPTVHRVPTFLERFIKFKDGLRKSATYKAKYVSAISPDHTFRIDGSAANSPVAKRFDGAPPDAHARSGSGSSGPHSLSQSQLQQNASATSNAFQPHRVSTVREEEDEEATPGGAPVLVEPPPRYPAEFPSEVLVISRDGRDFALDDMSTVAPTSVRTPTVARQPSSVYSGPPLSAGATYASWDSGGPRRANTSSTLSGAYPRELRRESELGAAAAPATPTWLPAPSSARKS